MAQVWPLSLISRHQRKNRISMGLFISRFSTFAPEPLRRLMAWTPDGKDLIYATEWYAGNLQPARLWRVSATGGTPIQLGKDFDGRVFGLVVSPDGKQLGFDHSQMVSEFYAVEGLFDR
jgi:hypothetical protein